MSTNDLTDRGFFIGIFGKLQDLKNMCLVTLKKKNI